MGGLPFPVQGALSLAIVVTPVALILAIVSVAVTRTIGDLSQVRPDRLDRRHVREEDPAPRWRLDR